MARRSGFVRSAATGCAIVAACVAPAPGPATSQGVTITVVAGACGCAGFAGDGGPATTARLRGPAGIAVGAAGNLYIADTGNGRIREVGADGNIRTIAGNGEPMLVRWRRRRDFATTKGGPAGPRRFACAQSTCGARGI